MNRFPFQMSKQPKTIIRNSKVDTAVPASTSERKSFQGSSSHILTDNRQVKSELHISAHKIQGSI